METLPEFTGHDALWTYTFADLGVACAIDYDPDAYDCDTPIDWAPESIAVLKTGSGYDTTFGDHFPDGWDVRRVREYADDVTEAFTRHYRRKGWDVAADTYQGCSQSDWVGVVVATAPGYGTAESVSAELRDWWSGDIYRVTVYAPYDVDGEVDWYPVDGGCGGVYLTGATDAERKAFAWDVCAGACPEPDISVTKPTAIDGRLVGVAA